MSSLRKNALSGMYWTFIQQMSNQGISFIVSIILARLLLPEEFGVIAMLSVFIAIGNSLTDSGLSQSLIRTENTTNEDYSTIFFFNLFVSLIIYLIFFFAAPLIAEFYNQPILINVTRIYCLTFIINAFSIIQNTRLAKEMDFKKQTIISVPSLIIGSVVGIISAINGFGVWSLVWSALAKSIAFTIQLWWRSPWVPSLIFDVNKFKYHFNFGYKLTLSGVIDSIFKDIYTVVIGKFFDPIQVGFYNRANTLKQYPVSNFGAILNKVTFPLFSKIKNNDEQLKNVYKKILQMSVFIISPTLFIMAALAEPLFRFLFTEKWLPAVPYFQILCFNGILYPIHAYNLNILTVKGRSDLFLRLEIIKKIIVLTGVFISFRWGIYGLLYGSVFLSIFMLLINTYYTGKFLNYHLYKQLLDIIPAILIGLISAIVVFGFDLFLASNKFVDFFRLTLGSFIGIITFLCMALIFKLNSFLELKSILTSRFYSSKRI